MKDIKRELTEYRITIIETGTYKEKDNSIATFEDETVLYVKGDYNVGFVARAILHELQNENPDGRYKIGEIKEVGSN